MLAQIAAHTLHALGYWCRGSNLADQHPHYPPWLCLDTAPTPGPKWCLNYLWCIVKLLALAAHRNGKLNKAKCVRCRHHPLRYPHQLPQSQPPRRHCLSKQPVQEAHLARLASCHCLPACLAASTEDAAASVAAAYCCCAVACWRWVRCFCCCQGQCPASVAPGAAAHPNGIALLAALQLC
jgi:hypothetical protein